ncbi:MULTISPECIES: hypothetical protein [unclassified Arthrobacter]|uniref:hypothetical protein n=1 Tax=unclassified Arthrobacter TaxID=235627 RepID=UPI002107A4D6|nr:MULTISPECIES: hypothetical protein [unclassified Arthrobacter]MCQ1945638.1 hypothetical protein [Arthrobacter sp. zg-Y1116]MCQ1994703.1 hypothetical protein [Arthrobacter sp. zg-Y1171]UWX81223.1 hypothetical protein N2L00_12565 [Arthrobacter sp. zg-Y1171]
MEQDNERDYLGRQYGPESYEAPNREMPSAPAADPGPGSPETDQVEPRGSAAAAVETDDNPAAVPPRALQVGTVVWGLVLTVLAVLLLLVNTVNLSVDPVLLVLCLTLGAGLALLVGGFLSGLQRTRSR